MSGVYIETCYDVYADMSDDSASPYLRISGLCIYGQTKETVASLLPAQISVRIGAGATSTFTTGSEPTNGAYSPLGNWMEHYIKFTAPDEEESNLTIPNNGSAFTISVTITPNSGSAVSFTESACGIYPVTSSQPAEMTTGRIYEFTCSKTLPVDSSHRVAGSLSWFPHYADYPTTESVEYVFVDAYTPIEEATASFNKFYCAIDNHDSLPSVEGARADSNISVKVYYNTADFYNGVLITDIKLAVTTMPRSYTEVDTNLYPDIDSSKTVITASPADTAINGIYVARYARLSIQVFPRLKYRSRTQNYYLGKLSVSDGTKPAQYFTFDANNTVSVPTYPTYSYDGSTGQHVINDLGTLNYYGQLSDRWTRGHINTFTIGVQVYGYFIPSITNFSVHRCVVDSGGSYIYNGTRYSKNDYGAYCLIEWGVKFTPLGNSNTRNMTIKYGTTTQTITLTAYEQSGYMVVPANTERTMDVTIRLWDKYTTGGVSATTRLSTAGVLIDWLSGGKGMAVGKVAETRNMLDINPDWRLLFYQATVGNYNGTTDADLIAWMHDIDDRLTAIENSETAN